MFLDLLLGCFVIAVVIAYFLNWSAGGADEENGREEEFTRTERSPRLTRRQASLKNLGAWVCNREDERDPWKLNYRFLAFRAQA